MRVDVFSIFPELVDGFCSGSLLGKARETGVLDLRLHDPVAGKVVQDMARRGGLVPIQRPFRSAG